MTSADPIVSSERTKKAYGSCTAVEFPMRKNYNQPIANRDNSAEIRS